MADDLWERLGTCEVNLLYSGNSSSANCLFKPRAQYALCSCIALYSRKTKSSTSLRRCVLHSAIYHFLWWQYSSNVTVLKVSFYLPPFPDYCNCRITNVMCLLLQQYSEFLNDLPLDLYIVHSFRHNYVTWPNENESTKPAMWLIVYLY